MLAYALSIFSAAFLLFLVQPLIAKFLLPWFGGGAAVWTTCLLFFQVFLLVGYAYAHASARWLGARAQALTHVVLLAIALVLLPITPRLDVTLKGIENPTLAILLVLAGSIGLQYALLAATSPLLSGWFARTQRSDMPYRLYSLSNVGSLLALFAYPVLVEPELTRSVQSRTWSWGFAVFAVMCGACAWRVWRSDDRPAAAARATGERPRWQHRLGWLVMPTCASVLLLAVTNKLTQDVAPVPFLWVLPLALYLLSFVVCFDNPRWYSRKVFGTALVLSACAACFTQADGVRIEWQVTSLCSLLFCASMVCHGEVYRRRPAVSHLTSFYLTIAFGGALGGFLVAVVAPLVYTDFYEMPLGMLAVLQICVVLVCAEPGFKLKSGRLRWAALALVACFAFVAWDGYADARYRLRGAIYQSRNFYGVLTVYDLIPKQDDDFTPHRRLVHGDITHGAQFIPEEQRRYPTTYYDETSGIGLTFETLKRSEEPLKVGAIGLGAGTVAAYGRPGDEFVFYEINPEVMRIALGFFTFLTDTPAQVSIVLGDARLSLASADTQGFDVLVIDAFSGDAIPVHLLTKEAFEIYERHMAPGGVIAVHISNNYLDLTPIVLELAEHCGLRSAYVYNEGQMYASKWVLLTHDEAFLASPALPPQSKIEGAIDARLWTDDDTNLLEVLDL